MDLVQKAYEVALSHHNKHKYEGARYIVHLQSVAAWVELILPQDEEAIAAAWLHDIIEDCNVAKEFVEHSFGKRVADMVDLCTDPPGETRKEKKSKLYERMNVSDNYEGLAIKVCDRLDNVLKNQALSSNLIKMYRREHPDFKRSVYRDKPFAVPVQDFLDAAVYIKVLHKYF